VSCPLSEQFVRDMVRERPFTALFSGQWRGWIAYHFVAVSCYSVEGGEGIFCFQSTNLRNSHSPFPGIPLKHQVVAPA
jgi:hypothetical protein